MELLPVLCEVCHKFIAEVPEQEALAVFVCEDCSEDGEVGPFLES